MKAEWFQKLRKDGEADIKLTSEMGKPSFKSNKQYVADTEAKYKREKENKAMKRRAFQHNGLTFSYLDSGGDKWRGQCAETEWATVTFGVEWFEGRAGAASFYWG